MLRYMSVLVVTAALVAGCDNAHSTPREGGGVKVRAPGVKIDVDTDKKAKDRKVDVDVNTRGQE